MRLRNSKWNTLLGLLFMGSVALALLGRLLCTRSYMDYEKLRPESYIPDVIETVLWDEDMNRLYVCYNDANRVNVYDGAGTFLWSVGTPWMRNSEFELLNGELVIFQDDAYRYDAVDGSFLGMARAEELPVAHSTWDTQTADGRRAGPFLFDANEVFREGENGERTAVVSRPWWHCLFISAMWLLLAFLAAIGLGISLLLEKRREAKATAALRREEGQNVRRDTEARQAPSEKRLVFQSTEARFLRNYYRAASFVQIGFVIVNIVAAFFVDWMNAGLFVLAVHFIVSCWVLSNKKDRLVCDSAERAQVEQWSAFFWASFVLAVFSVLPAAAIAGAFSP